MPDDIISLPLFFHVTASLADRKYTYQLLHSTFASNFRQRRLLRRYHLPLS